MNPAPNHLYVTQSAAEPAAPSQSSDLLDPSRRKSLFQIAALTGAAALPFTAKAQFFPVIWISYGGQRRQVDRDFLLENLLMPAVNRVGNFLLERIDTLGMLAFMSGSDEAPGWKWEHGRIRDWMSRSQMSGLIVGLFKHFHDKNEGLNYETAVGAKVLWGVFAGMIGAYFTHILEALSYIKLMQREGVREQPARYIASQIAQWTTPVLTWFLYPMLLELVFGGRRLSKGMDNTIEDALGLCYRITATTLTANRYDVSFMTVSRFDDDMFTHTSLDHFINFSRYIFDFDDLLALRRAGYDTYVVAATVNRRDNPQIADTCYVYFDYVTCRSHDLYTEQIKMKCTTRSLPYC